MREEEQVGGIISCDRMDSWKKRIVKSALNWRCW